MTGLRSVGSDGSVEPIPRGGSMRLLSSALLSLLAALGSASAQDTLPAAAPPGVSSLTIGAPIRVAQTPTSIRRLTFVGMRADTLLAIGAGLSPQATTNTTQRIPLSGVARLEVCAGRLTCDDYSTRGMVFGAIAGMLGGLLVGSTFDGADCVSVVGGGGLDCGPSGGDLLMGLVVGGAVGSVFGRYIGHRWPRSPWTTVPLGR